MSKLYVGNLPYETSESDLQALFEGSGQVSSINIVRDRATGRARGFAFVEMSDSAGAQKAIAELDFRATISVDEGMKKLAAWVEAQGGLDAVAAKARSLPDDAALDRESKAAGA